jgi:glyoxylase-like metal-dependent hydrolase (beta-lactamase superfamily II)
MKNEQALKTICLSKTRVFLRPLPSGWLLIDTGYDRDEAAFRRALAKAGIALRDIRYLFLTHHHDDHSGLTQALTAAHPGLCVIMGETCSRLLPAGENARQFGGGWCSHGMRRVAELYRRVDRHWDLSFPPYRARPIDVVLPDADGDLSALLGIPMRVVHTPGHTPDSLSLIDAEGNWLCGDAAANYLNWAGTRHAPAFVTDFSQFYGSWRKVLDLGIRMVRPAHGRDFHPDRLVRHMNSLSDAGRGEFVWD